MPVGPGQFVAGAKPPGALSPEGRNLVHARDSYSSSAKNGASHIGQAHSGSLPVTTLRRRQKLTGGTLGPDGC